MKKIYNLVFLFCAFFASLEGISQSISYPVAAQPITRGLDSTLLTVRLKFPSGCNTATVTINLGATNSPGSVQYIAASLATIAAQTKSG